MKTFIDLSHLNPITNLAAVKASGIAGVILKGEEGVTYQDPLYAQRVQEMKASGITILSEYAFYHPEDDPTAQAANDIANCQNVKTIAVDLEWLTNTNAWAGQDQATNDENLRTYIATLVAGGFEVKVYTSKAFIEQMLPNSDWLSTYDLWVAWYNPAPPAIPAIWNNTWWGWQYTGTGSIPGVSGYVDISFLNDGAE